MRPYSPLELAGRNIYIREGCYVCHSQMIRPFRDEVERYGHYSLAAESMYDHPFQWGSKRTGPDLARVGGRYSNDWHVQHLDRAALGRAGIDHAELRLPRPTPTRRSETSSAHLVANRRVGVPYSDDMIANAAADLAGAGRSECRHEPASAARYPKAVVGDFDGDPTTRDRDGRARRLSADARNAGRLLDLRRRSQLPLRRRRWNSTITQCAPSPTAGACLSMSCSSSASSCWTFRPGARKAGEDAAQIPFKED